MAKKKSVSVPIVAEVPKAPVAEKAPKAEVKAQVVSIDAEDLPVFKKVLQIAQSGVPDYMIKNFAIKMLKQIK